MQMFGTRGTAMVLATMFGFLLALAGAPSAQGAEMTRMQVAWSEPVDVVVEVWLKDFFGPKADSVSGANGIPQSRLDDPRALGPTTAQFVDLAPEQNRRFAYRVCYESYPATDAALHLTFTNPDGTKLSRDYPVPKGGERCVQIAAAETSDTPPVPDATASLGFTKQGRGLMMSGGGFLTEAPAATRSPSCR